MFKNRQELKAAMLEVLDAGELDRMREEASTRERMASRRALIAEKAAALQRADAQRPAALEADEQARAAVLVARKALEEAEDRARAAHFAAAQVTLEADAVVARVDAELRATASAAIESELDRLHRLAEEARHIMPRTEAGSRLLRLEGVGRKPGPPFFSTAPNATAYITGLRAAIQACEQMKLEALTDEEVRARVAALEAELPNPDELVEVA